MKRRGNSKNSSDSCFAYVLFMMRPIEKQRVGRIRGPFKHLKQISKRVVNVGSGMSQPIYNYVGLLK
jgi:hypothetical protein